MTQQACWVIIPAAGQGARMQASSPKQYFSLGAQTILEHSLKVFVNLPFVQRVVVALSKEDVYWSGLAICHNPKIMTVEGGLSRAHSVLNGLLALSHHAHQNDWVMVHDAVRPCVRRDDVERLWHNLQDDAVGGLLGYPVTDTLKKVDEQVRVSTTMSRANLWHALTPQMFRYSMLSQALQHGLKEGAMITDEASAIEALGHQPRMIEGCRDNIKVTLMSDLALAERILESRRA